MGIKTNMNNNLGKSLFKERRFVMMATSNSPEAQKQSPDVAIENAENERNAQLFISQLERARLGSEFQNSFELNPNPYKQKFLDTFKKQEVGGKSINISNVQNIEDGIRVVFSVEDGSTKTFDITDDAYRALTWKKIVERVEAEYKRKGKPFNLKVFADAVANSYADSDALAGGISRNINIEDLQRDYMRNREEAAREFESAIRKAWETLYTVYNYENLRKMGNEELADRIRACLRLVIDKNSDKFKYLDDYDVVVELDVPGRPRDRERKPATIYLKSKRAADGNLGMKITLTEDNISVENGTLHGNLPGVGNTPVELPKPLQEIKQETVKKLKTDIETSWDLFMKDGHPESNWFETHIKSHRANASAEYARFLREKVDSDTDLQRGLGLLTSNDLKDIHLRFNGDYSKHFLSVSYVRDGNYPGIQIRWYKDNKLVDNTKDVYRISSKPIDQMDISRTVNPDDVVRSSLEHDNLYSGRESVYAASNYERRMLEREMRESQAVNAAATEGKIKHDSGVSYPTHAPDMPSWEICILNAMTPVNPEAWEIYTDSGRANTRADWIRLGLPAHMGAKVFEGIFNQFRKCTDEDFLKNKTPEQQDWYRNPFAMSETERLSNLGQTDKDFHKALCLFINIRDSVRFQVNHDRQVKEQAENAGKTPLDKGLDILSDSGKAIWRNYRRGLREKDPVAIGATLFGIWGLWRMIKAKRDSHGFDKFLWGAKGLLLVSAGVGCIAYLAKTAGYDFSKYLGGKKSIKGTALEDLGEIVHEAKGESGGEALDFTTYARASTINMAKLYEAFNDSKGKRHIDPKLFPQEFPEFEGKSAAELEKNKHYKDTGLQLFLLAKYLKQAYESTLMKQPEPGEKIPPHSLMGKSLGEALSQHPYHNSDVAHFTIGILRYWREKNENTLKVDENGYVYMQSPQKPTP